MANEKPSAESKETPPPETKKSGKGKLLFIIIGVIALVGAAAGGAVVAKMMMAKQPATAKETTPEDPSVAAAKAEAKGEHGEAAKESSHGETAAKSSGGHGEAAKATPKAGGHGEEAAKSGGGHGEAGGEKGKAVDDGPPVYKLSKPVITNLKGSPQKVFAQIWIEATSKDNMDVIRKNEYLIMDKLVFIFSGKSREDLTSQEGLDLVKKEIKVRLEQLLGEGKIKSVGFDGSVNVI